MVVCNEEACLTADIHNFGNTLGRVRTLEIGLTFVKFNLISVINSVSEEVFCSMPHRLSQIAFVKTDKADVAGLDYVMLGKASLVNFHFKAVKSKERVVGKLGVRNKYIVVGVRYDRVTEIFIYFLDFLRGLFSVGKRRVTVQICLIKITALG